MKPEIVISEMVVEEDFDERGGYQMVLSASGTTLVELFKSAEIGRLSDRTGDLVDEYTLGDYDHALSVIVGEFEKVNGKVTTLEVDQAYELAFPSKPRTYHTNFDHKARREREEVGALKYGLVDGPIEEWETGEDE